MYSCDTETTGLSWQHGAVAFAIGLTDGTDCWMESVAVDPKTRKLVHGYSNDTLDRVRGLLFGDDPVVFQNANYDIKALCRSELLSWEEPDSPEFWENILELGHLVHLHDSTDAGHKAGLKKLTPKYLGRAYESVEHLDKVVLRARNFVRHRDVEGEWKIATEESIPWERSGHNKMDMWLPAALRRYWKNQDELREYMGEDYKHLTTVVEEYLQDDCNNTLHLAQLFLGRLLDDHSPQELESLLSMNRELHPVIWKVETRGIPVHKGALDTAIDICTSGIESRQRICKAISGIDKESYTDSDLREILITKFGLTSTHSTPKTGKPSVDKNAREAMLESSTGEAREFLEAYQGAKELLTKQRYLESYSRSTIAADSVPYDIRCTDQASTFLFPQLNSVGTGTTRFSSSNPNAQNIGTDKTEPCLRSVFRPEPGRWWLAIDYSQLQLRIFAAATEDPRLIQSFEDGYDFHDFMAKTIFGDVEISKDQRRIAKNTNFGFIFGASSKKIDQTAGIPGLYRHLMEQFPGAKRFIQATRKKVEQTGCIHTLQGYPMRLPLTQSPWGGAPSYPAHLAVNYLVQGTEGQLVKKAMVMVDEYLTEAVPDARIVLNIHDEIIIDIPARLPKLIVRKVAALMEEAGLEAGVTTPVDVELCQHNLSDRTEVTL